MVAAPHIQRGGTVPARKEGRLDGRFRLEIDDRRRTAVQRAEPLQRTVRHVHDRRCVAAHVEDRTRSLEEPATAVHLQRHARAGFSSPAYLSTVFRAATGLAPRDYRKSRAAGR